MKLVDVYSLNFSVAAEILIDLLREREPHQSISHKEIPTMREHIKFIDSRPYKYWYVIFADYRYIGAIYLTKQDEVGIGIFKQFHRRGYGIKAIEKLMKLHPNKCLANINPENKASIKMFEKLGFKKLQVTYESG